MSLNTKKVFYYPENINDLLSCRVNIINKEKEIDFEQRKINMEKESLKEEKTRNEQEKTSEKFSEQDFEFKGENEELSIPERNAEFKYKSDIKMQNSNNQLLQLAGYANLIQSLRDYYNIKKTTKNVEIDAVQFLKFDYRTHPILYKLGKGQKFSKIEYLIKSLFEISTSPIIPATEISKRAEIFAKLYMKYHYNEIEYDLKYQEEEDRRKRKDPKDLAKSSKKTSPKQNAIPPLPSEPTLPQSKLTSDTVPIAGPSKILPPPNLNLNIPNILPPPIEPPKLDTMLKLGSLPIAGGKPSTNITTMPTINPVNQEIDNSKAEKPKEILQNDRVNIVQIPLKPTNAEKNPIPDIKISLTEQVKLPDPKEKEQGMASDYTLPNFPNVKINNETTKSSPSGDIKIVPKIELSTIEEEKTSNSDSHSLLIDNNSTSSFSKGLSKNDPIAQLKEEIKKIYGDLMVKAFKANKVEKMLFYKQKIEELDNLKASNPIEKENTLKILTNIKQELKKG